MTHPEATQEIVIARLRQHVRVLAFPALALIAICGALGLWWGNLPEHWQNVTVGIAGAVALMLFCVLPYLRWLTTRYTLTTRRMIATTGLARRSRSEVLHAHCPGIRFEQTLGQKLAGSGDIQVLAEDHLLLTVREVPRARLVREAWQEEIWHAQGLA